MKNTRLAVVSTLVAGALALTSCGGSSGSDDNADGKSHEISWLLSRPADGSVITVVKQLADEYAKDHPGFKLNLITTPDRPSYLQKYETLATANQLPELFDTDATPFTKKLIGQKKLVDVEAMLKDLGLYDKYRPQALDYQRFDDGSLYMMPFEFEMEFFFYNKALFKKAGVEVPKTLDDFAALCGPLRKAGAIPIALDGQDGWPLERYVAYQPFRLGGPDYLNNLKKGDAKFSDAPGAKSAEWLGDLGKNDCFADGFSSQGYTDARDQFTTGKAAIYEIGTWELPTLASTDLPASVKDNIDYFTMPTTPDSVTQADDYTVVSGIGTGISAKKYDGVVKDFLKFLLERYPAELAKTGHLTPVAGVAPVIPANATPLYAKALGEVDHLGDEIAFPWDTQLDPSTNTLLQQQLTLLVQGEDSPEQFTDRMDKALSENAPKFFD
jgi:raffinose/stachyose/melibiose transport system substrate-binding protein